MLIGSLVLVSTFFQGTGTATDCRVPPDAAAVIQQERIAGSLSEAEAEARRILNCETITAKQRQALRIELATILDRQGLHTNTRPVAEAIELLSLAESDLAPGDPAGEADVALAIARYSYRAEMSGRRFDKARLYATRALHLYNELDDRAGAADATHLMGLIEFQQGHLERARLLFDRSLEISPPGPERSIFLSDYHRHVGLVDLRSDSRTAAIDHFEQSMAYRDAAGSRDYGLFARTLLGSVLIEDGRPEDARPLLEEALDFARDLPSPVGELRATFALGEMYEALGDRQSALDQYRRAAEIASDLGAENFENATREAVQRLEASDSR